MKDSDGSSQDARIEIRFLAGQINKAFASAVKSAFGEVALTPEELADLEAVYFPFDCDCAADFDEEMTEEEFDDYRAEHFAAIKRLRPTFLRLFKVSEDTVAYATYDLDAYIEEIESMDAFLVAAFRLRFEY
jgi:hypothetical protein